MMIAVVAPVLDRRVVEEIPMVLPGAILYVMK